MSSVDVVELRARYTEAGQGQVFTFFDELTAAEQAALVQQLSLFDPERINRLAEEALHPTTAASTGPAQLEPLPATATASIMDASASDMAAWQTAGLDLVAANKVAVVLMAGGQGTRLGSTAPKGCYDIGLPSAKSLFRLQAERIRKVQALAAAQAGLAADAVVVPWYIMTSGPTRGPTEAFFQAHDHFGLAPDNVVFFEQGVLPCISNDGKILLESRGRVATAPDGNGGLYQALVASGVLADLQARRVDHVHAYCVDNCLVRVADPVFVGFAAQKDVDVATKVVRKRSATESVGLILLKNGRPDVVEYSEIDTATAEALDPNQPAAADANAAPVLKFRAANIVNHYYSRRFLESIPEWAADLPHHVARKKIPYADLTTGATVKPTSPNGIKLEQFVFDVFPRLPLARFACLEVRREDEFSPLKNAPGTGEDDPETSRRDILLQGRRWIAAAGAHVHGAPDAGVEVSPLLSYGGEGLERFHGKTVDVPAELKE
ncbi:udp-n-acetylglucosamine pyrophosphorylase [Grosmannia clavigera kw1407]|uniref:UDP-N-acetylglucosamine diphosphorylase n=1 Tax=Grosmannia clavigera (strain kw1407 / UAMH 11150) TaxID=655863 RepID=F0XCK4_GROCL|nr:udp-n-acetylglucosamine pyrophosphorylase [Grosmannia clavigera kw1407]EFX03770.1 udp-n-acetylglucosamine pyrophosphorylase [Grosmannia clavigera kw1407]